MSEIAKLAADLRAAAATRTPILPLTPQLDAPTLTLAYQVQNANVEHGLAAGRRLVGRKIGLTSVAVQRQLGVAEPDFGVLFADMEVLDGEEIAFERLIQPKAEAEIAFVLNRRLDRPDCGLPDLLAATEYVLPALEIVDSRIADWKIGIFDTIADNASSGLYVLGNSPQRLAGLNLALCGMVVEHNGQPASFGVGAACLGHPFNAMVWLARRMAELGRPLDAGDVVLSGALGPMVPLQPGDFVEARINGLGSVRTRYGKEMHP
ncbi:MAG TPA: fumarylacetoacetate hydrolase family protein [Devosia sp.]|nr:fumarylacetoacetate hydrolase family protein [Devosia sp.]